MLKLRWVPMLFGFFIFPDLHASETLDEFFNNTQSMIADFEQEVRTLEGQLKETSVGEFTFKRPDKFILRYDTPSEQEYISNSKKIWIYDVELEQVTIKSINSDVSSPALILSNKKYVINHYFVKEYKINNFNWVELKSKNTDANFEKIRLNFKGSDLSSMEMYDSFGSVTKLSFFANEVNVSIPDGVFEFQTPDGVDIIGQ